MAELEHLGGKRAESARARRAEQLRRWRGSPTEQEPAEPRGAGRRPGARRGSPRVRFEDGAVFLAACSSGDTDEVRRLLARGADVDTVNVDGLTALHQVTGSRGPAGGGTRAAVSPAGSPPGAVSPAAGQGLYFPPPARLPW
uniref:Protein phosphatase 1 regulatory subunit 12C n=1 Tax=Equus caballus TaxID=9796 RepID=A0A9L0RL75_HORSE